MTCVQHPILCPSLELSKRSLSLKGAVAKHISNQREKRCLPDKSNQWRTPDHFRSSWKIIIDAVISWIRPLVDQWHFETLSIVLSPFVQDEVLEMSDSKFEGCLCEGTSTRLSVLCHSSVCIYLDVKVDKYWVQNGSNNGIRSGSRHWDLPFASAESLGWTTTI